jgi:hypothetical protein
VTNWSLPDLLANIHSDVESRLAAARKLIGHPGEKGDASESVWRALLTDYLPARYGVLKAYVVDSENRFSDQIDLVICDRQYSPLIFKFEGATIVPAESVYAFFEAKQEINAGTIEYARKKAASVRQLRRTSLDVVHAGGKFDAVEPKALIAGILALESGWSSGLGEPLLKALEGKDDLTRLDLGCVASQGRFAVDADGACSVTEGGHPATAFLFDLIARLQEVGTVPRLDVRAYAKWLG